jgi:hypothetical protein
MRVGAIRSQALLIVISAGMGTLPSRTAAQENRDELTPRAIADSTYAVRVTVDALAESIRRGQLNDRQFDDPQLAAAVGTLASAAARRSRRPPHADLRVLWDLQISCLQFQPEGPDMLRALVQVELTTAPDSASIPARLTFGRRGDRWDLTAHEGLVDRLIAIATAIERPRHP